MLDLEDLIPPPEAAKGFSCTMMVASGFLSPSTAAHAASNVLLGEVAAAVTAAGDTAIAADEESKRGSSPLGRVIIKELPVVLVTPLLRLAELEEEEEEDSKAASTAAIPPASIAAATLIFRAELEFEEEEGERGEEEGALMEVAWEEFRRGARRFGGMGGLDIACIM